MLIHKTPKPLAAITRPTPIHNRDPAKKKKHHANRCHMTGLAPQRNGSQHNKHEYGLMRGVVTILRVGSLMLLMLLCHQS